MRARILQKLPDPIARVAEKGEQLVDSIEQVLGPAGNLLSAVNEFSDSIAKLPSEAMLGERFAMLQQNIDDSSRESASALVRMDAKVDGIADSLKKLAGHAGETTRKLDVLDRLARRSLFAILTGRDGEEKRD